MGKKTILLMLAILILIAACDTAGEEVPSSPPPSLEEASPAPSVTATAVAPSEGDPLATNSDEERVILRFTSYDWAESYYRPLIRAFEEETPDIKIEFVRFSEALGINPDGSGQWPQDAPRRLASAADVIDYATGPGGEGLWLDLTPFMQTDPNVNAVDFYPTLLEQAQGNGGTWFFPMEAYTNLIYFHKDLFDEAGIDYPEPGWTWDEFLETANALTRREDGEVVQWGYVEVFHRAAPFIEGKIDEPLINRLTDPPIAQLDTPAVRAAMQWYTNLFLLHEVAPYFPPAVPDENGRVSLSGYELINSGRAAMWVDASYNWHPLSRDRNVGVVPYPVEVASDKSNAFHVTGLVVSAGTKKPQAAWRWLVFLSENVPPDGFYGGMTTLPPRRSVAQANGFWEREDEELTAALRYALDHAYERDFRTQMFLEEAAADVLSGEKSVDQAMAEAQTRAQEMLERQTVGAPSPPAEEIVVAESTPAAEIDADTAVIKFATNSTTSEQHVYRQLAQTFRATHPDIVVELQYPDFSASVTPATLAANADCFQGSADFGDTDLTTAVLSLDAFFDADSAIEEAAFYDLLLEQFRHQGQIWGVPAQANVTVMAFNKALFDNAGLDYPAADWTIDDFLSLAISLTQGEGDSKQYGYAGDQLQPDDLLRTVEQLGAELVDESTDPPTFLLNDAQTVEAVEWYTALTTQYALKPLFTRDISGRGLSAFGERQMLIENGRAAMWADSGSVSPEANPTTTGFVPLPSGPDRQRTGTYHFTSGYFISAATEMREACWQWITFLATQPEVAAARAALPAHRPTAESAAYRQLVGDERAAAMLATIESATPGDFYGRFRGQNSWMGAGYWWLAAAYDQILYEEIPVAEALNQVQAEADRYRDCLIARDAFDDEAEQQQCLQETDKTLLPDFLFAENE